MRDFASAGQWARLYRQKGVQVVPACSHLEVGQGQVLETAAA